MGVELNRPQQTCGCLGVAHSDNQPAIAVRTPKSTDGHPWTLAKPSRTALLD